MITANKSSGIATTINAGRHLLLVEDELELGRLVKRHLEEAGYRVEHVATGEAAIQLATQQEFDLVLLDLMLPGIDGIEVCQRLRGQNNYTPILMLTARATEVDKVLGLEMGADDYLTKPFGLQELVARVRAMFRRIDQLSASSSSVKAILTLGDDVRLDQNSREVWIRGKPVVLTRKEFDLLLHFVQNPGRAYTRAQLLDAVWGYNQEGDEHAVNCHINRLRAKIEIVPSDPKLLLTVWGVGYKFSSGRRQ
jgi:DNA-binding response OmpR family regulator